MKKKTTSKVTSSKPVAFVSIDETTGVGEVIMYPKQRIEKLEPFGNEDMHKVINTINKLIDAL